MLSPLDERYSAEIKDLFPIFSEFNLMSCRVNVEVMWLFALEEIGLCKINEACRKSLNELLTSFSKKDFVEIKNKEKETRHDIKAVEYFLKDRLFQLDSRLIEWVHFGLTSEDINNLSYALILSKARNILLVTLKNICKKLRAIVSKYAETAMLSRTHGQFASPTTFGKEVANFVSRLECVIKQLKQVKIFGKLNGAVGNFNALVVCFPDIDWLSLTEKLVNKFGLNYQRYTTQIEPHDWMGGLSNTLTQINVILLDLVRDFWGYNALGYLKLQIKNQEVGSSTMPHKINPIDFENSEGNLGVANALFQHFSTKLPISRWQRDLSDSTVLRNWGVTLGHSLLAYRNLLRGLDKVIVNEEGMKNDLENHWEVLAEPIQMILRKHGVIGGYELLKKLTRGKKVTREIIKQLVDQLPLTLEVREQILKLKPWTYLGLSVELAKIV